MKTYIWRVENSKGEGCYQKGAMDLNDLGHHIDSNKRPMPWKDGIYDFHDGDIFGFNTLEQAKRWFSKMDLIKCKKNGYELKKVEVTEIIAKGFKQVVAIR